MRSQASASPPAESIEAAGQAGLRYVCDDQPGFARQWERAALKYLKREHRRSR